MTSKKINRTSKTVLGTRATLYVPRTVLEVLGRHLFQSPSEKGGILVQKSLQEAMPLVDAHEQIFLFPDLKVTLEANYRIAGKGEGEVDVIQVLFSTASHYCIVCLCRSRRKDNLGMSSLTKSSCCVCVSSVRFHALYCSVNAFFFSMDFCFPSMTN